MTLCSSKDKGSTKPRSSSASPISNEAAKADHHYKQALLLRKEKRYPEAVNAFKEAIRLRPNDPCIYHNLAHNYEEMGVLNEALAAMNQAVSLGSSDANHLVCRGRIFMKMQQTQNAIKDLRAAVEIKPDNAKAHHLLGHAYERAGNMKEALNNLKRSLDLEPGNKGFLICYENLQKKMGKS
jgi:Flp pilus assembly protein TadD